MRLYSELAPWFHLVTSPDSYEAEAAHIVRLAEAVCEGSAKTLLELGAGGGNNASHLKRRFSCTLTDLSARMLDVSRALNPECEHLLADMRTIRLERQFDVVLVHDAIDYMTTKKDLGAAITTVAAHVRPGGVAILTPDAVTETFSPGTRHGGHDGADGRALRYLEWTHDRNADDTTCDMDFVFMIQEPGQPVRVEHDHHTFGLFSRKTWLDMIEASGLQSMDVKIEDPHAGEHVVFVARRPT